MTDEDLGCTPSVTEQGKFEYSPLGKMFNRGLDEDDQKKGCLGLNIIKMWIEKQ